MTTQNILIGLGIFLFLGLSAIYQILARIYDVLNHIRNILVNSNKV